MAFIKVKAETLQPGDIIQVEGELVKVQRMRRIDHKRGRLDTERGVAVVPLSALFSKRQ